MYLNNTIEQEKNLNIILRFYQKDIFRDGKILVGYTKYFYNDELI